MQFYKLCCLWLYSSFTFHSFLLLPSLLSPPLPSSSSPPPLPSSTFPMHTDWYGRSQYEGFLWEAMVTVDTRPLVGHGWHKISRDVSCFSSCIHKLVLTFSHFVCIFTNHIFCWQHFTDNVYLCFSLLHHKLFIIVPAHSSLPYGLEWRREVIGFLDWLGWIMLDCGAHTQVLV